MAQESGSEDSLGIILHGYDENQAGLIGDFIHDIAGRDVFIYGSGGDGRTVMEIIEAEPGAGFYAGEDRMLMFLGFDDELIERTLEKFYGLGLPRPIFCTLTENNMGWTVPYLMGHLLEEKREFDRRGKSSG